MPTPPGLKVLDLRAQRRVYWGVELLSAGSVVVTDRLHGHLLCLLLDIPHVLVDNIYGKVSSFAACWGTRGAAVRQAAGIAAARAIAQTLSG